jgi:hypothetical protein
MINLVPKLGPKFHVCFYSLVLCPSISAPTKRATRHIYWCIKIPRLNYVFYINILWCHRLYEPKYKESIFLINNVYYVIIKLYFYSQKTMKNPSPRPTDEMLEDDAWLASLAAADANQLLRKESLSILVQGTLALASIIFLLPH